MPDDIILLHGALGAAPQLDALAERLAGRGHVHVIELPGHGATPRDGAFSMPAFVDDVVAAMDAQGVRQASFFGYSMGGYVALLLAAAHPARVQRVTTLGTKFRWDPATAARDAARLDPATIRAKVPRFADALAARHAAAGGWERVLERTAALLVALGDAPPLTNELLGTVRCPVRVMVGDRDATVSVAETDGARQASGGGQLAVLPGTPHPIEQVDVEVLARLILL